MNMIRPMTLVAGLLGLCALASAQVQPTRADSEKDPIFKAMLQELDRSKNELQLKGFEKPFFIQYRIEDVDTFDTRAEFGASEGSSRSRQRVARVTVRVGDYKTDSSGQRGVENDDLAMVLATGADVRDLLRSERTISRDATAGSPYSRAGKRRGDVAHEPPAAASRPMTWPAARTRRSSRRSA